MNLRPLAFIAMAFILCSALPAQENPATPGGSQRGNHDGGPWRGGMGQRGVMGTVANVAPDHFTVKTETGETWTVHYSANTRFMKQPSRPQHSQAQGIGSGAGQLEPLKSSDIKPGDAIMAMGERDEAAKSVGAIMVMQIDPERAKQFREMQANFGKTWLMGRVTAINETKITLHSGVDNADHTFVADENTSLRRRREPITLADIQVGDNMRVEGAVKDGQFVATTVNVMMPPAEGGPARRQGPPPQ